MTDEREPDARAADPTTPLVRASRAWSALRVSPALESLAFLAQGVARGRPPRGAACPEHVLGPLVGTVVGPVAGPTPRGVVEEVLRHSVEVRGVTRREWLEWQGARSTPQLLEDVTVLLYRGSCGEAGDSVRCTCVSSEQRGAHEPPVDRFTRHLEAVLGPVPALIPDPSGQTDPWQEALMVLASRFRGPGSPLCSKYAGTGPPTINDTRNLVAHLHRLAGAFAGPRRVDRMAGLGRVAWDPPVHVTRAWSLRDGAGGAPGAQHELFDQLLSAAGCDLAVMGIADREPWRVIQRPVWRSGSTAITRRPFRVSAG